MELLTAAESGDEKACERLLEAGVNPNYRRPTVSVGYLSNLTCLDRTRLQYVPVQYV